MDSVIAGIGQSIAGIWSSGGVEFWAKLIGSVLLPLLILFLYYWVKRQADAAAEEAAKVETEKKDREDREKNRAENDAQNSAIQKDAEASKNDKEAAKKILH